MPNIIKNYEIKKGGSPAIYPWEEWLQRIRNETCFHERKGFQLKRGRDFDCEPIAIDNNLRKHAREAGFRVSIHHDGEILTIFYAGPLPKK